MDEEKWASWVIQTSKRFSDMDDVLKYINIDFIDYDHKMLVELAFKLNLVLDRSETEFSLSLINETKALLTDLLEFAKEHFDREENFMDLYRLPNTDFHRREHDKIITMLRDALDSYDSGKTKLTRKLKAQVMDWLIKHINIVDFEFFSISNWSRNIINASNWEDVKPIIRLVGINEIDDQHQKMTEIALFVLKVISNNPSDTEIDDEFNRLKDYGKYHFDYETTFMEKWAIPNKDRHLNEHDTFFNKLEIYRSAIKQDHSNADGMKEWLLTWWITHINTIDKEYFAYNNWAYRLIENAQTVGDVLVVLRRNGIEEIDTEHEMLMDMIFGLNKLITESEQDHNFNTKDATVKSEVVTILDQIYDASKAHFTREEKMMRDNKMEDLRRHLTEHTAILTKIAKLRENYISGRLYLSANVKTMLLEWWIEHTNTTDFRTFGLNYKAGGIRNGTK